MSYHESELWLTVLKNAIKVLCQQKWPLQV